MPRLHTRAIVAAIAISCRCKSNKYSLINRCFAQFLAFREKELAKFGKGSQRAVHVSFSFLISCS